MKKWKVGVLGATGMVGQRFLQLLGEHPWYDVTMLAASPRSAGKTYPQAINGRWLMTTPMHERYQTMTVVDASDVAAIASCVDFVFCAVDMKKHEIAELEEAYARAETPVVSNNSAHRATPDVPMMVPELNYDHMAVIESQRKRLGTRAGFIAVKPNCSIQGYVPALHPLREFGLKRAAVCTYQAISGAGKNFDMWPEMIDNVIPYIGGEEEKSEQEPLKIWGGVSGGQIVPAIAPVISAQCYRVPVTDGHMAAVSVEFERKPGKQEILDRWAAYAGLPQRRNLPSAPKQLLHYFEENDRPQTKLDRDCENGMAITLGRLREDAIFDYRFVGLSHNTLRGAAGGAVLTAEMLCDQGYIPYK